MEPSLKQLQMVLAEKLGSDRVRADEPMAARTSYHIGGPADVLVAVRSVEELVAAVILAREIGVPYFVLGAGSNILVADSGVRGLVIENRARVLTWAQNGTRARVTAESGASLGRLARQATQEGWNGLTWACGIPGTVGGGVVQNAGAHGGHLADVLQCTTVLDGHNATRCIPAGELNLAYRSSIFKQEAGKGWVILSAEMALQRAEPDELQARMAEYDHWRRTRQPAEPSCGSVFKNPSGDHAGRLIKEAGLRGERFGGAEISPRHANFIVNTGSATAADVMALIHRARETVMRQFGVTLEMEIELVGEWAE